LRKIQQLEVGNNQALIQ